MNLSSLTPDKQVKLQYWLDVIRQCRASGLTNQILREQQMLKAHSKIHPAYHPNISHNNRKINHQIVSSELLL